MFESLQVRIILEFLIIFFECMIKILVILYNKELKLRN